MIRVIIFFGDILIFGNTTGEILMTQDPVIVLQQHLGFGINF